MVIWRCAWHPKYHGYPLLYRATTFRGRRILISDGICRRCNLRLREDLRVPPHVVDSTPMPVSKRLLPAAAVALLVLTTLLLLTQPLDMPAAVLPMLPEAPPQPLARVQAPPTTRQVMRPTAASRSHDVAALPRAVALERAAWRQIGGSSAAWSAPVRPAHRARATSPELIALGDQSGRSSGFGVQTP